MDKIIFAFGSVMAGFASLMVFTSFHPVEPAPLASATTEVVSINKSLHLNGVVPGVAYSFAGEQVPIDNFDVRERLDREMVINTYHHSTTMLNLKLANRYFPVIEPILREQGVPEDFKYLCVAESALRMATSPANAKGLWQFLKSTGEAYGLEVNDEVDERFHVEKSTIAACKFLHHLKNRFGSWTLAAAAYNMGETGMSKQLQQQKVSNYYDLHLNEETSRYVFRCIAIKEVLANPGMFGFSLPDEQLYPEIKDIKEVQVASPIANLAEFAQQHQTTYRMLKVLNPWLISNSLTPKGGKVYTVMVPA